MIAPPTEERLSERDREKRGVALSSPLAAVGLTSIKLVVGVLTNSLGILAEAAHSALDLRPRGGYAGGRCASRHSRPTASTPTATASSRTSRR